MCCCYCHLRWVVFGFCWAEWSVIFIEYCLAHFGAKCCPCQWCLCSCTWLYVHACACIYVNAKYMCDIWWVRFGVWLLWLHSFDTFKLHFHIVDELQIDTFRVEITVCYVCLSAAYHLQVPGDILCSSSIVCTQHFLQNSYWWMMCHASDLKVGKTAAISGCFIVSLQLLSPLDHLTHIVCELKDEQHDTVVISLTVWLQLLLLSGPVYSRLRHG
jgi:hypothetical protein